MKTVESTPRGIYEKVPGSGIWWIRYADHQGRLRREKIGRRSDALALYSKRKTAVLQRRKLPENFRVKNLTFRTLCDDALEHCKEVNSEKSAYELELKIAELLPTFGDMRAEDIKKQDIVRWLGKETEKRAWKPASRNRWQAAFSFIFRVGVDNEKIETNPAAGIRRKVENNGRIRFLSPDEEKTLRRVITDPCQLAALDLSLNTGMRMSEQYGLQRSQVNLESKQVHLPKTKNGNARHIPLNATAVAALETLLKKSKGKGASVFPNGRGGQSQGARGWFVDAVERAELVDYTWHCNRHTFASRLVMAGVDLRTVAELMGHRSLTMTMRYAHLAPSHTASAVDRLLTPQLTPALSRG